MQELKIAAAINEAHNCASELMSSQWPYGPEKLAESPQQQDLLG